MEKAHGDNWREWLGHLKDVPAYGLECGTWMGESAEWALSHIFTHPDSHYICVDTFEGSAEHHLAGIDCSTIEADTRERLARFVPRFTIEKGYSNEVLRKFTGAKLDFIYIDAAHDSFNVLRDAMLAFDLLKVGGVMIFDDLCWEVYPDPIDRPRMAIEAFVNCSARKLEVIGMGWQMAIRKTSE